MVYDRQRKRGDMRALAESEQARFGAQKAAPSVRKKIRPLSDLAQIADRARHVGHSVVLAHGTFDLLHMGHVRHLEQARAAGDLLIVTVTSDLFVNKGPGRPVFPGELRAEMLAALSYVDWVGLNDAPTAENVIKLVRPDVYVKGSDYAQTGDDITGNIVAEREIVERLGGRVHFTQDIMFSSSALLNRHFDVYEPELKAYLDKKRDEDILGGLFKLVDSVKDMRVLLVGDTIIDEYHYVSPLGKSPKENLIPTLYRHKEDFAGGVIAAANHVAGFCRQVDVVTCLGEQDSGEEMIREALKPNVNLIALKRSGSPTTRKRRFVDADYLRKLFEVCIMDDSEVGGPLEAQFVDTLSDLAPQSDVVIATDFGHGLLTAAARDCLQSKSKFLAVNTQSNSANYGFNLITKYRRADYLCIDAPEARLAVGTLHNDIEQIAGECLPSLVDCSRFIITHGRHGCLTYDSNVGLRRIPAFTRRAVDTMGAGDAFLAVTAPMVGAGCDLELVGFVGNAVGAIKVGIVGHRNSVERIALLKYFTALLK